MIDLKQCDELCTQCVKHYIAKHNLKKGNSFKIIGCRGIPKEYIPESVSCSLDEDPETVQSMLDPVLWAKRFLDWHCLDPDGSIWKRKTEDGTIGGLPPFDPADPKHIEQIKNQKSIFHRPYQYEMLSCTSKRKVFRLGRQLGKTEVLCVAILYSIFTNRKFHVEILTPFQSQIDLIFKRLTELISTNKSLLNSISRSVKAPQYTIELKNGSQVKGFTAGTGSNNKAGSSRGQSAAMLVFDEADMLSPEDIDAALAVIINFPNATVWMSSTPTGKREKFYKSCMSDQYREFHLSSLENPNWTPELEAYFREELTEDGYEHEILAKFGEQEQGVYKVKYVEAAQAEWKYREMKPNPKWSYMIGVDWNDYKIGTTIAVVGLNPQDNIFYVVDKHIISIAEKTQLVSCQKIAEINRLWNASFIYVDQGYGHTQIEVLKDYGSRALKVFGANHPDARLREIVKPYNFSTKIEIRDLFTGQPVKKESKPFLVENSARRFESLQIKYPKSDKSFTQQLLGYIVDRVSYSGLPMYKAQSESVGDHFLDAVNLALVAFTLEKTRFGKPVYTSKISITVPLSENSSEKAEEHRPKQKRTEHLSNTNILPSSQDILPAAHTNTGSMVKLWAWPGFESDKPAPRPRSLRQAFLDAQHRTGTKRKSRKMPPRRKKF